MDPWSFSSEGKGVLFSDEMDFPFDAFGRSRKALMEWDTKPSYCFENDGQNVEFMGLGSADITGKHFLEKSSVGEFGSVSSKQVVSPTCIITPNSSFGAVESEIRWKLSGSVIECNSHDSSPIDLQLGRLGDCNNFSKERSVLSSGGSSLTTKRARTCTSSYSQKPLCQVQGCHMDLSSSKDYHKRHRVCVAHSKTSRVVVNGIEQRFCQQCSRFHVLAEFDDGKRSCRKRLAGHNKRRRKPQLDSFSAESRKFLQSIQGARFVGDTFSQRAPFAGVLKFDEDSQLAMNGPLLANIGKQYRSTPSNVQELCGSSNYSCALSLLSTQSQDFLSYPAGNGMNPIGMDHNTTDFEVHRKGIFHSKPQQGTTVDLLQLSSRLQRVEQRRSSVQIKRENEDLFTFLTT